MRTKIFCDIADFKTIKFFNKKSIVDGFTTNPSLMRLAGAKNYKDYSLKILKVCKKKPISFEVFADEPKEMLFLNIGSGSLPLSAILPAKIDIIDFVFLFKHLKIFFTCFNVYTAVIFNFIPLSLNSFITEPINKPLELTTGIFT